MAAPLNQNEIDALLTSDAAIEDDPSLNTDPGETAQISHRSRTKHFGSPDHRPYRFHFEYYSPVIKMKDIVLDPDPESDFEPSDVVVRSISNYVLYRKKNRPEPFPAKYI